MKENRWMIHRIGLINFWYYDEEEFDFCDGRLLLRGSNGSGKSVTMQSFIPLLLDGNKSPERLDPFGSRARKLENYLLGEDENDREERTGYLFMEFCKQDTGNFMTIGMGLKAKRGKSLDFWGFSITDGRRIGKDFLLYKDVGEKIPLSKIELRNRIGIGGELYDTQKDYMSMVNRLLFGFESIDDYDELIKLLIQIRTPKLSKDFKPTVIYEIMNNSLQPLSDDDLRPMSEAIENMDNIRTQLDVLKESKSAADRLKQEYSRYNRFVLLEKARDFVNSQDKLETAGKNAAALENERDDCYKNYLASEAEQESLKSSRDRLEHKKQQLEQHDSFKAKQEIEKLDALLKRLEEDKTVKDKSLNNKKDRERQLHNELKNLRNKREEREETIRKHLEEMSELASDLHFDEHFFMEKELSDNLAKEYEFKLLRGDIDRYRNKIIQAKKALEQEKTQSAVYDRALEELEHARKEREDARREVEKTENLFVEAKEEFTEQVYAWEKQNEQLKLPGEVMVHVSRAINQYEQAGGYDAILGEVRKQYNEIEFGIKARILEIEAVKSGYLKQLKEKQLELDEWKKQKDPEPPRDRKVIANRQRLDREGIPYLPLYKAVEFREDLNEQIRGRIEETLLDMGLLDALIVPKKYWNRLMETSDEMGDKYISPNPQFFRHELSSLLKVVVPEDCGITGEDVDDALRSILLDKQDGPAYINEEGEYSLGILKGKSSCLNSAKFIGAEARRRYRQENITRLEAEISKLDALIAEEESKISALKVNVRKLNEELSLFPGKKDLETAYNMVFSARMTLDARISDCIRKEEAAEKAHKILKELRDRVREFTDKMEIAVNLEAYEQAETDATSYRDMASSLENMHLVLLQLIKQIYATEEQLEEVLADIDTIHYDLRRINRDIQDSASKKQNYEELLKELNYDEIENEIEECIRELREIPEKIEKAIRNAQIFKDRYEAAVEKLDRLKADMVRLEKFNHCYREGFRREYNLGYVVKYEEQENIGSIARRVCQELKGVEKEGKLREDFAAALQEKYHQNRHYMTEYNLIMEYIFEHDGNEIEDEELRKAYASQKRLELSARIQGRDVNFPSLAEFIEESIEENEKLLRESDRQLFEDILANTVGKKIRAKIFHSEQWVKKMNTLMESMNTSSGLSFSLVWKNRTAETEEQMDTRELVEILKSDAGLLKEEDMDKLASHFRSKIAQARKELEEKGAAQTFHAIMKDILDYRKWFEFQLFFKKTGETRKELTNNAFDKFSGGEKAMAMYVPLFSAVYARYEGGRKDCPRVISLDEAFAGVDEKNINDMFRLMEELRLNFIINSQILWGDYETVPALSICELVRPNNADFVTVIRYRWNGKVRRLISGPDETVTGWNEAAVAVEREGEVM